MPHMMAGVMAPPRWQCNSASGILRASWRVIRTEDTARRRAPASHAHREQLRPIASDQLEAETGRGREDGVGFVEEGEGARGRIDSLAGLHVDRADRIPPRTVDIDAAEDAAVAQPERDR